MSNNSSSLDKLPPLWEETTLGQVVEPTRPRINPAEKPDLQFIGMDHIEAQTMRLLGSVPASTMKSSAVHFQPGDVLYGRLRPYLNKVYRPTFEGLCSAEFIVFPESEGLDNKYLQYLLNSYPFVSFATHLNTGDRPRVKFEQLAPYPFPLPPSNNKNASLRKSKNNSPGLMKPLPTSSASRPTSNATKPPSSKPLSKANSPKNGANNIPM